MCSNFQEMEKYGGDLTDILRAGGSNTCGEVSGMTTDNSQFQNREIEYQFRLEEAVDEFGDPFSHFQDPLLHNIQSEGSSFFSTCNNSNNILTCSLQNQGRFGGDQSVIAPKMVDQEDLRRPTNNFFTRMLQISPNTKTSASPRDSALVGVSPRVVKDPMLGVNKDMISSSKGENNAGLQISSPRNAGIKRRKSQAKKVVCVPAPAPANSRPSGEVVPSDLWAWRKYGQKPIKGSPYPRGYYRCSSSKGCPARKQVERSRTDPNMLVIAYTCEHNHPWPTQRNALAGSTRTQLSKNLSSNSKTSPAPVSQSHNSTLSKPESKDTPPPSSILTLNSSTSVSASVKEEAEDDAKQMEVEDTHEFSQVFQHSYQPALPDSNQPDDFFAELGELEADPMNLLFPDGYSVIEDRENKSLDPFTFYDWAGDSTGTSLREDKKG